MFGAFFFSLKEVTGSHDDIFKYVQGWYIFSVLTGLTEKVAELDIKKKFLTIATSCIQLVFPRESLVISWAVAILSWFTQTEIM